MKNILLTLVLLALAPQLLAQVSGNSFVVSSSGPAAQRNPSILNRVLSDGRLEPIGPVVADNGVNIFDALGFNSANPTRLFAMNAILPTPLSNPNLYQIDLESGLTVSLGSISPPPSGLTSIGVVINFIGTGGDEANYFLAGLVLDVRPVITIFPPSVGIRVSNPRLYIGEIKFNSGNLTEPQWRQADISDPATAAIINGYVTSINNNPSNPAAGITGGPRDWVFVRENGSPTLKSYLGVEGQFLTVSNITTSPVIRVTTPAVPLPVRAELGAMFSDNNNLLYAINTDGGPNAGQIYQIDPTTGNYLNLTLNTGLGLFRGDATTILPSRPLPVTLTSFVARLERARVSLRWTTATEAGTDRFRVERSVDDAQTWVPLGEVKAANAQQGQSYSFVDEGPSVGMNYYRLAIVDFDGTLAYSPVQAADFQPTEGAISLYPNPATEQFTVALPQAATAGSSLQVLNSLGQQVWTQPLAGLRTVRVDTKAWATGVYYVKVVAHGRTVTQKVVVQP
jgi:hypothetical protein